MHLAEAGEGPGVELTPVVDAEVPVALQVRGAEGT